MAFKILRKDCCDLDVHKTWIYACIGITEGLRELACPFKIHPDRRRAGTATRIRHVVPA